MRVWNNEVFGDVEWKKLLLLDDISRWDRKEGEEGLDSSELVERKEAQRNLERILEMEEIMWRQKSRVQWLKEGDNDTKFFHKMDSVRATKSHIH